MRTILPTTRRDAGFTIVEVLISLTIFSIAVAGVITMAAQGGLSMNAARNKVIAGYLADEGVELMRLFRDSTVVSAGIGSETAGWTAFTTILASECVTTNPCDLDPSNASGAANFPSYPSNFVSCPLAGFCPLYYTSEGYYTSVPPMGTTPTLSAFRRKIVVTQITPDEMRITSTVAWVEGSSTQSVAHTENVYNWYRVLPP